MKTKRNTILLFLGTCLIIIGTYMGTHGRWSEGTFYLVFGKICFDGSEEKGGNEK